MTLDLSVYLVTDSAQALRHGRTILDVVTAAVAGGVTAVQVRAKHAPARETLELLDALAERVPTAVGLLVNDRVDVLLAARARGVRVAGVHVGQSDLPVEDVRAMVGPEPVIGLTTSTASEVAAAASSPARVDYVGIGTVRETASKPDAPRPLGTAGVVELARGCPLPAVAIGGIEPDDLPALRTGGLAGAAVVSWVCAAPDPEAAAQQLARGWGEA